MTRRLWVAMGLGALIILSGLAGWTGPAASSDVYGLVIGIDDYAHLDKLQGARNDASDLSGALEDARAQDVLTMLDAAASRHAVLTAWDRLVSRSAPGDTLIFAFSGYGGIERQGGPDARADRSGVPGQETLLLRDFNPGADAAGANDKARPVLRAGGTGEPPVAERITHGELFSRFAQAHGRRVLFIVDAGTNGYPGRPSDHRTERFQSRFGGVHRSQPAGPSLDGLPSNTIMLRAAKPGLQVHELRIEGEVRGALTWAVARGFRGAADLDRSGTISAAEIVHFAVGAVRVRTAQRQLPSVLASVQKAGPLVPVAPQGPSDLSGPVMVHALGGPAPQLKMRGGAFTGSKAKADLIWDPATGTVITALGDRVAEVPPNRTEAAYKAVEQVARQWHGMDRIQNSLGADQLYMTVVSTSPVPVVGETMEITIWGSLDGSPLQPGWLTLINFSSDGTVQMMGDLELTEPMIYRSGPIKVVAPAGVDHMVALWRPGSFGSFLRKMGRLDGRREPEIAADLILEQAPEARIGFLTLVTAAPSNMAEGQ